MLILALDSTSKKLSISITTKDCLLSNISDSKSDKHIANIVDDIEKALNKTGRKIEEIDAFSVNLGPGDFTGGRIGISIVKIFSLLSSKPVYGFNSLDVFAAKSFIKNKSRILKTSKSGKKVYIFPLMDVRNKEIYFGIYEACYFTNRQEYLIDINKTRENTLLCLETEDGCLCLKKKFKNYLLPEQDINIKIHEVITQLIVLSENCCSSCLSFIKGSNQEKSSSCKTSLENLKNGNKTSNKVSLLPQNQFIITGNIFPQYDYIFENFLKKPDHLRIKSSVINYKIVFEKNNIFPESKYLNLLAYHAFTNNVKPGFIAPVYAKEFTVFKKEKN